jgi:hypothetical protein
MELIKFELKQLGVWLKFKRNILNLRNRHWLERLSKDKETEMIDCFDFSSSPEGFTYWWNIHKEISKQKES